MIEVYPTKTAMAAAAARCAAAALRDAITRDNHAAFVAATGASQFEFLAALADQPTIDSRECRAPRRARSPRPFPQFSFISSQE